MTGGGSTAHCVQDFSAREGKIGPFAAAGLRRALMTGVHSGEITAIQWDQRRLVRLPDSKNDEPAPRAGRYGIAGAKHREPFKSLSRSWSIAGKYVGLLDVRLHDLRHSYASLSAGRGVSLHMIGKLLGHKVPATTRRYAHLARDVVQAVNDNLGAAMQGAIRKPRSKILGIRG
jgi:integrase